MLEMKNVTTDITLTCFRKLLKKPVLVLRHLTQQPPGMCGLRCSKVTLERYRHKDREAILMPSVKSSALWSKLVQRTHQRIVT